MPPPYIPPQTQPPTTPPATTTDKKASIFGLPPLAVAAVAVAVGLLGIAAISKRKKKGATK
jgi:hypothetical protein